LTCLAASTTVGVAVPLEEGWMEIRYQVVAIDAAELEPVSTFWAGVLEGTVDVEDDWHMVMDRGGVPRIGVQLAPNHVPPDWPDGEPQQQLHLDLWVDDLAAAHEEVMALGATLLQEAPDLDAEEGWQVYADPAGHPFCLCWNTALR
jgi:predicted enzyme related to lactoylglutathione lyase